MGKALYRTHRSTSFDEVVGQAHITEVLQRAVARQRFSHAYLLTGPRGVGKTSVARILAHEINQLPYSDSPHIDIIEIDAASNRRIDDIRDLREKVYVAPAEAAYKIYIIDEVHMLTSESFNALLKTLEEPPEHVIFILATTDAQKLPATVMSRVQRFTFRLIEPGTMTAHLRAIAEKEGIAIDDQAIELIAEHGEGTFRDSISLLDQVSNASDSVTAADVERVVGLAPRQQLDVVVEALQSGNNQVVRDQLAHWQRDGIPVAVIVKQLSKRLLEVAGQAPELYRLIDDLQAVPEAYDPRIKLLTTLLLAIDTAPSQPSAPKPPRSSSAHVARPSETVISSLARPAKPASESKKTPTTKAASKKNAAQPLTLEQWETAVGHLRTDNPPLYSVVSKAHAKLDATGHVLTLSCKFALHARKLDDPKYRAALSALLQDRYSAAPDILVKTDPSLPAATAKPAAPAPSKPASGTAASVIAMMGGGEIIDA